MSCRNRSTQEESVRAMRGDSDESAAIWHYTCGKTCVVRDADSHFLTGAALLYQCMFSVNRLLLVLLGVLDYTSY